MVTYRFLVVIFCLALTVSCRHGINTDTALKSICIEDIDKHIRILSSDEFEGRAPGTAGEIKTINYLEKQFKQLGLEPGYHDSYFQDVPLITSVVQNEIDFELSNQTESLKLKYGEDFIMYSPFNLEEISTEDTKIAFVGFGIVAPEYNWDDYANINVEGKIVFMLTHDPGFYGEDNGNFRGKEMTYYGRNSHKFEEAAKRGAKGAIIIHKEEISGYKWDNKDYKSSKRYFLAETDQNSKCMIQGSIRFEMACDIFEIGKLNLKKEIQKTIQKSYNGEVLKLEASVNFRNTIREFSSKNIIAKITGKHKPEEYIFFTAHWDHLGIGTPIDGDSIYNGAADNAFGVSSLLEIAEAFSKLPERPDRTMVFMMPTAEERSLLGSAYYAANPIVPFNKVVANFNVDGIFPFGKMKDIGVIGHGMSTLDEVILEKAKEEGRTISPDENLRQGYFFRLDMYNFAKNGVPAVHIGTGKNPVDSVKTKMLKEKLGSFYHKPWDEYRPEVWDMTGMIDDVRFTFKVAYAVSENRIRPQWYNGDQ